MSLLNFLFCQKRPANSHIFFYSPSAFTLRRQVRFKFASSVFQAYRPSWWLVTLCLCVTSCTTCVDPVGGLSPSAHMPQVAPLGLAMLVACHPLLMCHGLHHLGGPSWWLVTLCSCATGCTTWVGQVVGLSPSAHVPQVAPLWWAKLLACHPLLMCHRLHHLGGPSCWLVTLCSCATSCTTWMSQIGGLSPSAHVPRVAPLGWAATNT